jgi:hypothetical protein
MGKIKYKTIQLPEEFVQKYIDTQLENKASGFSSRASVVKAGVRSLNGFKGGSDHNELMIFLINTFMEQEIDVVMPEKLEIELKEFIKSEM